MSVLRCLVLTASLLVASPSWGWGQTGHRITGELAQLQINGKTAAEIELIVGNQGLAEMSTWPDEQRSNPQPFWQKDANPWHYVTLPASQQPSELVSPAEGDALTALERFAAIVRDRQKTRDDRALALWLGDYCERCRHFGKPAGARGTAVHSAASCIGLECIDAGQLCRTLWIAKAEARQRPL